MEYRLYKSTPNKFLQQEPFSHYPLSRLDYFSGVNNVLQLPGLYKDSSNQIWEISLESSQDNQEKPSELICKTYSKGDLSPFWQGVGMLLDYSLDDAYREAQTNYSYIDNLISLQVPAVFEVLFSPNQALLAVEKIPGMVLSSSKVTDDNVNQLAHYLAELHQQTRPTIGQMSFDSSEASDANEVEELWKARIVEVLNQLGKDNQPAHKYIAKAIKDIKHLKIEKIVPLMMDLRWDQFSQINGQISGVFDLDAFVNAPVELDFVILEYLLDSDQAWLFRETYQNKLAMNIPDIELCREIYRVLFYLMNILGEENAQKWMEAPYYF